MKSKALIRGGQIPGERRASITFARSNGHVGEMKTNRMNNNAMNG
jgi:hypothetical protein